MDRGSVFALMAVVAGAVVILFPLVRALAERIRPRATEATAVRDELQALREDLLIELREARREIGDLNERIDFTERLLARKTEQR